MFKKPLYLILFILMLVTVVAAGVFAIIYFTSGDTVSDAPLPSVSVLPTAEPTETPAPEPTRTPSPVEHPDGEPDNSAMGTSVAPGYSGEEAALLQEKLMELYYLPYGTPTGVYDAQTEEAIMLFQQRNALPLTGIADEATVAMLFTGEPNYLVGADMAGPDVTLIQGRLAALGYDVTQTGRYGPKTQAAVKAFQAVNGIMESGVMDRASADLLLSADAKDAEGNAAGHNFASPVANNRIAFINNALALEGLPRSASGRGPRYVNSSGFIYYVMRRSEIYTKFMDTEAWKAAPYETITDMAELNEGDVLVFEGHLGIYLADGSMIHSSSATGSVTVTPEVAKDPYFIKTFVCAKRMF